MNILLWSSKYSSKSDWSAVQSKHWGFCPISHVFQVVNTASTIHWKLSYSKPSIRLNVNQCDGMGGIQNRCRCSSPEASCTSCFGRQLVDLKHWPCIPRYIKLRPWELWCVVRRACLEPSAEVSMLMSCRVKNFSHFANDSSWLIKQVIRHPISKGDSDRKPSPSIHRTGFAKSNKHLVCCSYITIVIEVISQLMGGSYHSYYPVISNNSNCTPKLSCLARQGCTFVGWKWNRCCL
jgi:hypothetical protein